MNVVTSELQGTAFHAARAWPRVRPELALLTAFWGYVTLSNVLYGTSMQASLAAVGIAQIFAPWDQRVMQHLILYPALLGSVWLSRRLGWRPPWRAVPLQLLCGVGFAALGTPAMALGEYLVGWMASAPHSALPGPLTAPMAAPWPATSSGPMSTGHDLFLWLAAGTSFLLTYGFALALLTGFDFYRRFRDAQLHAESLERSLTAAHLAALRMQLSPHTLFNLLHTIRGNISWDPAVAQSMIVQFSDLLRRLLRAGEHELSRLHDELEFARLYLQLQQRRFADRLAIALPDPDSLPAAWVPSLILQPLIENAVVHGLAHHMGPVTVCVDVSATAATLLLRVVNTVAPGTAAESGAPAGIGLSNVRERLQIQFGERASLHTTVSATQGWVAELRLPWLRDGALRDGALRDGA